MSTTSKIGTAGGGTRDYSTIALWLASVPSTPTGGYIGECYNDSEFAPAGTIAFSGHTTSSGDFITLRCASGQSFRDNASVQTNALRYNVSNGVGIKGAFGGGAALISIGEDYITVDGLQVWQSRAYAGGAVAEVTTTSATHSVISGNILQGDGGDPTIMKSGVWRNNLVLANPSGGGKRFIAGGYPGTIVLANNTFASFSDAANPIGTVFGFFGTPTLSFTNNAIFGAGTMGTTTGITGNNTCSDLAISFGSNNQASKTYANQFTNTTIASGDFKVKNNSADLYDHGITDTTDVPAANDIALTSRPQGSAWDIGAWELVVAGGNPTFTIAGIGAQTIKSAASLASSGLGTVTVQAAAAISSAGLGAQTLLSASKLSSAGLGALTSLSASRISMAGVGAFSALAASALSSAGVGAFNAVPGSLFPTFSIAGAGAQTLKPAMKFAPSGLGVFTPVKYSAAPSFSMAGSGSASFIGSLFKWTSISPATPNWTPSAVATPGWTPDSQVSSLWTRIH